MMDYKKEAMVNVKKEQESSGDPSTCTDLVLYKEGLIKEAKEEAHPEGTVKIKQNIKKSAQAYLQGSENGDKVALSRPIEHGGTPQGQIR